MRYLKLKKTGSAGKRNGNYSKIVDKIASLKPGKKFMLPARLNARLYALAAAAKLHIKIKTKRLGHGIAVTRMANAAA